MDIIELRGLRVLGTHGCLAEERERAQPFELDLDVEMDLAPAARADDVSATVDYGALAEAAARVVTTQRFSLLETLAEAVAQMVLADERVVSVTVAVRKLRPPVAVDIDTAGVRITRTRTSPPPPSR